MKNRMKLLSFGLILTGLVFIYSCKDKTEEVLTAPVANFTFDGTAKPAPANAVFQNASTNATSYLWNFGDSTTSTEENPQHLYTTGGNYEVKLTATGDGGSHSVKKIVTILNAPTKVKIDTFLIVNMPFVNATGSPWDATNGPDVYIEMLDSFNNIEVETSNSTLDDVLISELPFEWTITPGVEISDFKLPYFVNIWDADPSGDQLIGNVRFLFSNYLSGPDRYPGKITMTKNGSTITLSLVWY